MPGEVQRELEPVGLAAPKSWVEKATNFASVEVTQTDRRLTYDGGALLGGEEGVGGQPSSLGFDKFLISYERDRSFQFSFQPIFLRRRIPSLHRRDNQLLLPELLARQARAFDQGIKLRPYDGRMNLV